MLSHSTMKLLAIVVFLVVYSTQHLAFADLGDVDGGGFGGEHGVLTNGGGVVAVCKPEPTKEKKCETEKYHPVTLRCLAPEVINHPNGYFFTKKEVCIPSASGAKTHCTEMPAWDGCSNPKKLEDIDFKIPPVIADCGPDPSVPENAIVLNQRSSYIAAQNAYCTCQNTAAYQIKELIKDHPLDDNEETSKKIDDLLRARNACSKPPRPSLLCLGPNCPMTKLDPQTNGNEIVVNLPGSKSNTTSISSASSISGNQNNSLSSGITGKDADPKSGTVYESGVSGGGGKGSLGSGSGIGRNRLSDEAGNRSTEDLENILNFSSGTGGAPKADFGSSISSGASNSGGPGAGGNNTKDSDKKRGLAQEKGEAEASANSGITIFQMVTKQYRKQTSYLIF